MIVIIVTSKNTPHFFTADSFLAAVLLASSSGLPREDILKCKFFEETQLSEDSYAGEYLKTARASA